MSNFFKDCSMRVKALCNMIGNCCCVVCSPLLRCCTNWYQSIPCPKNRLSNLNTNSSSNSNSNSKSNSDSLYRTFDDDNIMDLL